MHWRAALVVALALILERDFVWAQRVNPLIQPVTVGVLQEDSVLFPLARFDGWTWRRGWPEPDVIEQDQTPTLASIPRSWWAGGGPVLDWEVVTPTGRRQRIKVNRTTWSELDYGMNVGLATNYVTPWHFDEPPWPQERRALAGIVASRAGLLQPITPVAEASLDFRAIHAMVPKLIGSREPSVWQLDRAAVSALTKGELRSAYRLSGVYAGLLPDGRNLYVFHAHHDLPKRGVTSFIGWLTRDETSSFKLLLGEAHQTDDDGKGDLNLYPLASLTTRGRTFWIAAGCGYEGGGYVIIEVGGAKPEKIAEMDHAGCGTTLMKLR